MTDLKPCPLCDSTNVTCFAEYDGDSYDNVPVYHAVVACIGCHEDGCDPDYDEEPCFGIEAYFRGDHPLIKDCEDTSDCERVLAQHMAERWNRRAERTCGLPVVRDEEECERQAGVGVFVPQEVPLCRKCTSCGRQYSPVARLPEWLRYCPNCGARIKAVGECGR